MRPCATILCCLATAITLAACDSNKPAAKPADVGADIQLTPAVRALANNPTPPANAQRRAAIGAGALGVNTANASGDNDSFWVQEIDIDGDGTLETVDVLWDDEDKVLFLYGGADFICRNGGIGSGQLLIALNGPGNPRNRPVGSGFYAMAIDESDCAAGTVGVWGCRFDANGIRTACGWVVVSATKDDIDIVEGVATR